MKPDANIGVFGFPKVGLNREASVAVRTREPDFLTNAAHHVGDAGGARRDEPPFGLAEFGERGPKITAQSIRRRAAVHRWIHEPDQILKPGRHRPALGSAADLAQDMFADKNRRFARHTQSDRV